MPTPAATTSKTNARVPFLVADSFVLALDDFMRRTHQGGHVSQSVIELGGPPNPVRLRAGLRRAVAKYPTPGRAGASALADAPAVLGAARHPDGPPACPFGWWREGDIAPGSAVRRRDADGRRLETRPVALQRTARGRPAWSTTPAWMLSRGATGNSG